MEGMLRPLLLSQFIYFDELYNTILNVHNRLKPKNNIFFAINL